MEISDSNDKEHSLYDELHLCNDLELLSEIDLDAEDLEPSRNDQDFKAAFFL